MAKSSFWQELKRRHVWRVGAVYAATAWLLLQLAAIVLPAFGAPGWVLKVLIAVFVICFPVALILVWAFELTPEGVVRRTEALDSSEEREPGRRRKAGRIMDRAIIVLLALALILAVWRPWTSRLFSATPALSSIPPLSHTVGKTGVQTRHPVEPSPESTSFPAKSIAVMPFEDLSANKDSAYLAEGMQDLILTKLAGIGTLKVISRTSTMKYANQPDDLKQVGRQLGVATVLEGSVQKSGNQVQINVRLISTRTDAHLWAHVYTRTLDNLFGVEGEVAEKVAMALNARLSQDEVRRLVKGLSSDPAANDLFLRAEYYFKRGVVDLDTENWKAAIPLYRKAIQQDANFALARAQLATVESVLAQYGGGGEDVAQLVADALAQARQALALAPDLPAAHLAIGYIDYYQRGDYVAALKAFAEALRLRPNYSDALAGRAYVERRQMNFDAAIVTFQKALAVDPRNSTLAFHLGYTYMMIGRYSEAGRWMLRALALDPNNLPAKLRYPMTILYSSGDVAHALAAASGQSPKMLSLRVRLLTLQRRYRVALDLLDGIPATLGKVAATDYLGLEQANLYWLLGESARARELYAKALAGARAELAVRTGDNYGRVSAWLSVAEAELGLGHTRTGLAAINKSRALFERSGYGHDPLTLQSMPSQAILYARAGRADLAVHQLAKMFITPGSGWVYSPVMLWVDPAWDPIRTTPDFQALLGKYAFYKPDTHSAIMAPADSSTL